MSEIPLKMIEGEYEIESQDSHSRPSPFVLDEQGNRKPKMLRVMTADQVKERIDLQTVRTAQYLRAEVERNSPVLLNGEYRLQGMSDNHWPGWDLGKPENREVLKRICEDDGA